MLFSLGRPRVLTFIAVAVFVMGGWSERADAQLGVGWISTSYTKKIHLDDEEGLQTFNWTATKSVGVGTPCADYAYDSVTDTETFRLLDGRTNRSEIRLQNEYATGRRQFEGYVTFFAPLDDESLFQIFGSTSGATLCMMRGYASNGGKLRVVGGIGDLVTGVYGIEKRINVIHDQNNFVQFYVDGVLEGQFSENEQVDNYWKYGAYGTVGDNVPAVVKWRGVRTFRDGLPPGAVTGPTGVYEAEFATLSGPVIASSQAGFTGTGYADFTNASTDFVNWTVNADAAGPYDLTLRYALQSGDRPLQIQVNGQVVDASLEFPATGAWTTWSEVTIPSQLLQAGTNTVRATATGSSGPNIDYLQLVKNDADFDGDGVVDGADFLTWQRGFGAATTHRQGDANRSGAVDANDLAIWRSQFGGGVVAAASAIPEPSGGLVAIAAAALSLLARTRWPQIRGV